MMQLPYDLRLGDCLVVLDALDPDSVDGCACDPPYHLQSIVDRYGGDDAAPQSYGTDGAFQRASAGFMGKSWDGGDIAFQVETWRKVYRVLKPGAWLFAFSGTRTQHRMVCAIEDAGFIIDDQIAWVFGSGMPKSHKTSIYIERKLAYRVIIDEKQLWFYRDDHTPMAVEPPFRHPEANRWWGWGTAFKPAWEPICVAQKPFRGGMADNVLRWGVGPLNIEAGRIPVNDDSHAGTRELEDRGVTHFRAGGAKAAGGRWPANLAHDGSPEVLAAFPKAPGQQAAVGPEHGAKATVNVYGDYGARDHFAPRGDSGSAARFFYCAKATRRDRNDGCDALEKKPLLWSNGDQSPGTFQREGTDKAARNNHPTVKPTDLMRWLCRLAVPAGGLVLDPFMGSGSTGKAAMLEGLRFIGIEMDPDYMAIAEARVKFGHDLAVKEAQSLSDPARQGALF